MFSRVALLVFDLFSRLVFGFACDYYLICIGNLVQQNVGGEIGFKAIEQGALLGYFEQSGRCRSENAQSRDGVDAGSQKW